MTSSLLVALGFAGATGPLSVAPLDPVGDFKGPPVISWERSLPGPRVPAATHAELGAPVIDGGLIYVGSAADDALLVLDRSDGRLVRRLPADGPVQSAPVIVDGRVWFSDAAGATSCYRTADGVLLWRHEGSGPILSSPTLDHDHVFVANLDNVVTALDAQTGDFLWRHSQRVQRPLAGPALYGAPTPTVITVDQQPVVLSGFADGTLVALGADSGDALWQRRVGEGAYPDLIGQVLDIGRGVIAGGFSGPLLSLDPTTRAVQWRVDVGSSSAPATSSVDAVSGLPTLFHGGTDGRLRRINARTGEVDWTWDSSTQGSLTQPVVTTAGLLVGSSAGGLYLVDPVDGHTRWTLEPGYVLAGVSARPVVEGRQAIVVTNAGRLISLIVPQSEPAWASGDGDWTRVGGLVPQAGPHVD